MKRVVFLTLLSLSVLQGGATPSIVGAQTPTPWEPAGLLVPAADLGSGWSLVESSAGPGEARAKYAAPGQVNVMVSVSALATGDDAAWWMARVRTDFAMAGNDLSDVPGLGDSGYGRSRATGGNARASYVFTVDRLGAVVEASSTSSSGDVQSLALQYAQQQAARFRAALASSTPGVPSVAPPVAPTPAAAPPPSVPAMVLPAEALGPDWVIVDRASNRGSERLQYFNNTVDLARFRTATIMLDMYLDEQQARAVTDDARSALEGFRYEVAPTPGTGRGGDGGFRAINVGEHGVVVVIRIFNVENVAASVSLTGIVNQQRLEDVDADNLNLAAVQSARVQAVLAGQPEAATPPPAAWPSIPDPSSLVLPLDQVGPGWVVDAENDKGTAGDVLRTHARIFRPDAEDAPQRAGLIAVTLARDEAAARMALGMFLADWHAKGYAIAAGDSLGQGLSFPTYTALHVWAPDMAEAGYLYQTGRAVVQVSITSRGAATEDVLPAAADWARWQAYRVLSRPE